MEDARQCILMFNMFNNKDTKRKDVPPNGMAFDSFKKQFFPQFCIVNEAHQSDEEKDHKKIKDQLISNKKQQPQILEKRIKILDGVLK